MVCQFTMLGHNTTHGYIVQAISPSFRMLTLACIHIPYIVYKWMSATLASSGSAWNKAFILVWNCGVKGPSSLMIYSWLLATQFCLCTSLALRHRPHCTVIGLGTRPHVCMHKIRKCHPMQLTAARQCCEQLYWPGWIWSYKDAERLMSFVLW